MGGIESDYVFSIALDPAGYVYTIGDFSGTSDFNPDTAVYYLTSNGSNDIFISKLDDLGNFVWAITTVYTIFLHRRKWTKEHVQIDSLFIYKPTLKSKIKR
ncbi:MAG: hypothetical protein HN704_04705 [Bacteroidetes bacterium]|jgi:hypothetical protein|nr:hypothetical protein [Bacteroidota bacterium]MBT6686012.1 hypothetical protein [Bacteroidota bacterium]MBT7143794.1 hypothetical protein [Bacteroidota bacterium]MBT7490893.1 hypothetical protein [Bacteroidota bacterium]